MVLLTQYSPRSWVTRPDPLIVFRLGWYDCMSYPYNLKLGPWFAKVWNENELLFSCLSYNCKKIFLAVYTSKIVLLNWLQDEATVYNPKSRRSSRESSKGRRSPSHDIYENRRKEKSIWRTDSIKFTSVFISVIWRSITTFTSVLFELN